MNGIEADKKEIYIDTEMKNYFFPNLLISRKSYVFLTSPITKADR